MNIDGRISRLKDISIHLSENTSSPNYLYHALLGLLNRNIQTGDLFASEIYGTVHWERRVWPRSGSAAEYARHHHDLLVSTITFIPLVRTLPKPGQHHEPEQLVELLSQGTPMPGFEGPEALGVKWYGYDGRALRYQKTEPWQCGSTRYKRAINEFLRPSDLLIDVVHHIDDLASRLEGIRTQ